LRDQDIIALKFDAELTNAQIAQVMGLAEGKVGVMLYRTLRKLRKALEQES
jgi:RNA polymerase sigma-70 factor (ECF subfamily)